MQIKNMKVFCDVVERRSFSQAADDNDISQSTASNMVLQLEERLGVALLDRSTRPFELTPEGECYYQGCEQIVKHYEDLEEEVRTLSDAKARSLVVASIYSAGLHHLNELWPQFREANPRASLKLKTLNPQEVYECVESGKSELGLMSFPKATDSLDIEIWYEEPMVAVVPPSSPLSEKEEIHLSELAGEPFIAFDTKLALRRAVDRRLREEGVKVEIAHEFDNIENVKKDIEHGAGVSLLPELTVREEIALGTLAMARIAGEPLTRPLGFVFRRDRPRSELAQQFVALLNKNIEQLNQPAEQLQKKALAEPA
ncbi:MAG: LysR family transcriptional regulator [Lacipirellulaceae bacterium]